MHLDVCISQGPELYLDSPGQHESVLFLDVSTPKGLQLHLDMSTLQRPVGPSGSWTCLYNRSFYTAEACIAPGRVCTTAA
jgi:hypothetical protein